MPDIGQSRSDGEIYQRDILEIEFIELSFPELIYVSKTVVRRIMKIIREILGPVPPDGRENGNFQREYKVFFNGKVITKTIPYILQVDSPDKKKRGFLTPMPEISEEYRFWSYWFSLWGRDAGVRKEHWDRDGGTLIYALYITARTIMGELIENKPMVDKTIEALEENTIAGIKKLYRDFEFKTVLMEDVEELYLNLSTFYKFLRKKSEAKKPALSKYECKTLQHYLKNIRKIERKYTIPFIEDISQTRNDLIEYLLKMENPLGGWNFSISKAGISSPLNTGEVGYALLSNLPREAWNRLDKAADFLLSAQTAEGFWLTTRAAQPRESWFANAIATKFLLKKQSVTDLQPALNRIRNNLYQFDMSSDFHNFAAYCHSGDALVEAFQAGLSNLELEHTLGAIKTNLSKAAAHFEKARPNDAKEFAQAVLVESYTLALVSRIDDVENGFERELRMKLSGMIVSHPERPFPNTVTWYHESEPLEFIHWVKPWAVAALARQPFIDKLLLLDLTRNMLSHYKPRKGVILQENGSYSLWAAAHLLYALGWVLKKFE